MTLLYQIVFLLFTPATFYAQGQIVVSGYTLDKKSNPIEDVFIEYYCYGQPAIASTATDENGQFNLVIEELRNSPDTEIPHSFLLGQNFPNPFNPSTLIPVTLSDAGNLTIYDILGRQLISARIPMSGEYLIEWGGRDKNGNSSPAGVYFYSLESGKNRQTKKMVFLDGGGESGLSISSKGNPQLSFDNKLFRYETNDCEEYLISYSAEHITDIFVSFGPEGITNDTTLIQRLNRGPYWITDLPDTVLTAGDTLVLNLNEYVYDDGQSGYVLSDEENFQLLEDSLLVYVAQLETLSVEITAVDDMNDPELSVSNVLTIYTNNTPTSKIYVSYDGNSNSGILIIDTKNFAIIDSIIFSEGIVDTGLVPMWMKLSADSSHVYVIVNDHSVDPTQVRIALVDLKEKQIIQMWTHPLLRHRFDISSDQRYFFSEFRDTLIVYDNINEDITYVLDNDSLKIRSLVSDPVKPGFYASYGFKYSTLWGYDWILHYDVASNTIDRNYVLDNSPYPLGVASPFRLAVTTDGQFLFAANTMGQGIWNETYLHVIDLQNGAQVFRGQIGGYSHFAVTQDNRYLYSTDPGLPLNETVVPTGILFRYDILANSLEPYLDFTQFDIYPYFSAWPAIEHLALFNNDSLGAFSAGMAVAIVDLMQKELIKTVNIGDYPYNKWITSIVVSQ